VRDVVAERFGSASAVGSAFRQFGAVVGTAAVIAIIGDPKTLAQALHASDNAFTFGIVASLISGAVALLLSPSAPIAQHPAVEGDQLLRNRATSGL
jgi:hypothetical protein